MKQKYVILADGSVRLQDYQDYEIHAYMQCNCLDKDCSQHAVSAGFWDGERVSGGSMTLGINSRPQDTEIIKKHLAFLEEGV